MGPSAWSGVFWKPGRSLTRCSAGPSSRGSSGSTCSGAQAAWVDVRLGAVPLAEGSSSMDVVTLARTARENLARGLGALQAPGVPPQLMQAAEPIAQAMSGLHRIETTRGGPGSDAPGSLLAV